MPVILNNKNMAISDRVYQNKDVLDIFSDEDYPMFILLNLNTFSSGYFPILKKMTPKENI
jgi:hypothetical protein